MKQTKFAKSLALSVGVLVFSGAISYLIFAWTAPSSTPPEDNVAAPINTGPTAQGKMGNLGIGTTNPTAQLDVVGQVKISGGSPAAGKVLTSDASGLATWQTPSGGVTASTCPTGQWVIGINSSGEVICDGTSGFEPWGGISCSDTSDTELRAANARRIFITNGPYSYNSIDTAAKSDAICRDRAAQAGLDSAPYKALLINRHPTEVLASGKTFWRCAMISGTADWKQVAAKPSDFATQDASGNYLAYPIRHDQNGSDVGSVSVFSAYYPNGTGGWNAHGLCRAYSGGYDFIWGLSSSQKIDWARAGSGYSTNTQACRATPRYLYCVDATL